MQDTAPSPAEDIVQEEGIVVNVDYLAFLQVVALLSVVNSLLMFVLAQPVARDLARLFWIGLTVLLIADAVGRLFHERRRHLPVDRGGRWLDMVGSLPVPFFALFRVARTVRVASLLRREDYSEIREQIVVRRARTTIVAVLSFALVVLEVGALLVLRAEANAPDATIRTATDAIWWGIVTVSTVGYGDTYPVTSSGRAVGVLMIVTGVVVFSSLTSFMAQWFLSRRAAGVSPADSVSLQRVTAIRALLDEIEENGAEGEDLEGTLKAVEVLLTHARDGDSRP